MSVEDTHFWRDYYDGSEEENWQDADPVDKDNVKSNGVYDGFWEDTDDISKDLCNSMVNMPSLIDSTNDTLDSKGADILPVNNQGEFVRSNLSFVLYAAILFICIVAVLCLLN